MIFGRTLDPEIYDRGEFLDGVRRLALNRASICVRILLFDTREATRAGHRLIEMSRHLTSRIAIQCVSEDDRDRLDAFLVIDERGYVRRRLADTMEATADFDNPHESRLLRTDFEQMWDRSSPDAEMRRLYL
ncbi:GCN5-related N-acetyltransferase [Imhoffiella purpurea]|uniref:GCN5-related N-acetyltransferase n=1 Tax=Imhoffiella purpurea TaxID=1249627 RepID=W9VJ47_9GAMM|nr:GCN5-related N-acetyltransferase [Imhoffiella purpurea]